MVKPLLQPPNSPAELDVPLQAGSEVESRSFCLGVFANYRGPNVVSITLGADPTAA